VTNDPFRCTRMTKRGTACRNNRVHWWECEGVDPESCDGHLTPAERTLFHAGRRAYLERARGDNLLPACWSWPPPTAADLDAVKREYPNLDLHDEDWRALMMEMWHQGRCAICGIVGQDLVNDHDHQTGLERGLLCRSCNVHEGMNHGGVYVRYRQRNPASICGARTAYHDPFEGEFAKPVARTDMWEDHPLKGVL
jgi:hypothetical protein